MRISAVGFFALPLLLVVCPGMPQESEPSEVSIKISVPKQRFRLGERIPLSVEIHNSGTAPIYVGSHIMESQGGMVDFHLEVTNQRGDTSAFRTFGPPAPAAVEISKIEEENARAREDFSKNLSRAWVLIHPKCFYGAVLEISREEYAFLAKPGRYALQATYESKGFDYPSYLNPVARAPDMLSKLGYRSFRGELTSDKIWIEIAESQKQ